MSVLVCVNDGVCARVRKQCSLGNSCRAAGPPLLRPGKGVKGGDSTIVKFGSWLVRLELLWQFSDLLDLSI